MTVDLFPMTADIFTTLQVGDDREARVLQSRGRKSQTRLSDGTGNWCRTSLWSEMLVGLWKAPRWSGVITYRPGRGGWTVTGTKRERCDCNEGRVCTLQWRNSSCCQPLRTD